MEPFAGGWQKVCRVGKIATNRLAAGGWRPCGRHGRRVRLQPGGDASDAHPHGRRAHSRCKRRLARRSAAAWCLALLSAGSTSREELRTAIADGSLTASNTPQLGPRLFAALLEWLAYEPPPPPDEKVVRRAIELLEGLGYRVKAPKRI